MTHNNLERTVYFSLMTVYFPERPYIFNKGPYIFSSRPYIFRQDRLFSCLYRIFSGRTVYFTRTVYFQGPYIFWGRNSSKIALGDGPKIFYKWSSAWSLNRACIGFKDRLVFPFGAVTMDLIVLIILWSVLPNYPLLTWSEIFLE